jgi:oligopeptide transport system substrate-binding protein
MPVEEKGLNEFLKKAWLNIQRKKVKTYSIKIIPVLLCLLILLAALSACTGKGSSTAPAGSAPNSPSSFPVSTSVLPPVSAIVPPSVPVSPPPLISTAPSLNPSPAATSAVPPVSSRPPDTATGILKLVDSGPVTLDPAVAGEAGSINYIFQIFSGLLRLDENLNVAPDIAQSWDKSADGKTYTFHLRRDARFQDGNPVKAADFKYSWERALNPATRSQTAGTYLIDIVGASDILSGKAASLSGVRVMDDYTLQVTIDAPKAYFLYRMAYPTSFVVEKSNVDSGSLWWQKPIGTGPFQLKQWQTDQLLVLTRNNSFYGDRARVNEVDFRLLGGDPMPLYQLGQIDVADVAPVYVGLVTDPNNAISKELHITLRMSFSYIAFNTSAPPFEDVNVRQAFCYAFDKSRAMKLATNGVATPAAGILPSNMPGYNSNLQGLNFDAAKARQLLAASKYADLSKFPPTVITVDGYGGNISGVIGGLISDWKTNLGVQVTVRQLDPSVFSYSINQEKDQMFSTAWIADYPDPQDFLDVLFHTGSGSNSGGYSNPQADRLLDQAAVDQDPSSRLKLYQNAEQLLVTDAACLPLEFDRSYTLVKPYVSNYVVSPLGVPLLNKVSVQK